MLGVKESGDRCGRPNHDKRRQELAHSLHLSIGGLRRRAGRDDPPANLAKLVAQRETETAQAQANYTYRQSLTIDEFDKTNIIVGSYWEQRDIIFSPKQERTEQMVSHPVDNLHRIKLTDEDFRDIRDVQPFLLTKDQSVLVRHAFQGRREHGRRGLLSAFDSAAPDPARAAVVRGHAVGG